MPRNQYSVEQILAIVKQHENRRPPKELCWQYGFSEQMLERWRAAYQRMSVARAKRLKPRS